MTRALRIVSVKPNVDYETLVPPTRQRKVKGRKLCSQCDQPRNGSGRYCLGCRAEYMRAWRKTHPLNEIQKFKDRARSYANVYKRRGHLTQCPCEKCGSPRSQMHHENYNDPLDVIWLCRPCHLTLHRLEKQRKDWEKIQQITAGINTKEQAA